jgi:hypothetical protein
MADFHDDGTKATRCMRQHGLSFHIDEFGYLNEHRGWKSEDRPANEYELEMWNALMELTAEE